ncbi:ArsA family ATPase [Geomicrobium sp. JSM 1781026]|uniref:ArsA family ATPase n=1 Tax=Geomicrobium sp. JSM 1781026 TaxID=3344580 RepID=UPI0035C0C479
MSNDQIIFFGGKGGVGKSTSSSAYALARASAGERVLLVSTDPAHNLQDLFNKPIGNTITPLEGNLFGLEVHAPTEAKRYIAGVKENLKNLVHSHRIPEVHRQIDLAAQSPGADESALFDRLVSIILDETKNFSRIVFDTAPTGHTLRLLTLPDLMSAWINGMLKRRKTVTDNYSTLLNDGEPVEDPIYQTLMERKQKFSSARTILLDRTKTQFVYVLTPEKLPIEETTRAVEQLAQHQMNVHTIVVNKCMPEGVDLPAFFLNRKQQEDYYRTLIDDRFKSQRRIYVPLQDSDISSVENLKQIANYFP